MNLAAWILALFVATSSTSADTLKPWADAVAAQCTDAGATRAECARFAAQAVVESRFALYVLDGRCQDPAWLSRQRGCHIKGGWCPCDGGRASSPWQYHYAELRVSAADGLDPVKATATAWAYWKHAPYAWTTWRAAQKTAVWWMTRTAP